MPGSERKAAAKDWSMQSSPRRQWWRRGAAEEREEKGGSELWASATTGLTEDWEAGTEEAFAREGGTSGGRRQQPGHGGSRERCRRRRMRPTMLGMDAGETEEKRPLGNRERRRRWLGLYGVEKETEENEEAEVDGCDGELGRRDRRVDEDGDEADGDGVRAVRNRMSSAAARMKRERETAAAAKFAEDPAIASRRRKAVGFAVTAVKEEKATTDSEGRGRKGRRDRGAGGSAGGREGEEGGEAGADGEQREEWR